MGPRWPYLNLNSHPCKSGICFQLIGVLDGKRGFSIHLNVAPMSPTNNVISGGVWKGSGEGEQIKQQEAEYSIMLQIRPVICGIQTRIWRRTLCMHQHSKYRRRLKLLAMYEPQVVQNRLEKTKLDSTLTNRPLSNYLKTVLVLQVGFITTPHR